MQRAASTSTLGRGTSLAFSTHPRGCGWGGLHLGRFILSPLPLPLTPTPTTATTPTPTPIPIVIPIPNPDPNLNPNPHPQPHQVAFASAVPITFFFYMDQNISSLLCQLPEYNLQHGHYYHSSFLWIGLFNAVGPLF